MDSYPAEIVLGIILSCNHVLDVLSIVPWVIFMEPEIGYVGLNEAQAKKKYNEVNTFQVEIVSSQPFSVFLDIGIVR